jgi:hypothetical protein
VPDRRGLETLPWLLAARLVGAAVVLALVGVKTRSLLLEEVGRRTDQR